MSGSLRKGRLSLSIWLGVWGGHCFQPMRGVSVWHLGPDNVKVKSTGPGTGLLPPAFVCGQIT